MNALFILMSMVAVGGTKTERVNLVDSGRVVQFSAKDNEIPEATPMERGLDGWTAYRGEDGQFMVGVAWEAPRDVAEVNIEFRHAIAHREKIKVQYFQYHESGGKADQGRWVTAKIAEWWAGDRDVSFTFAPVSGRPPTTRGSRVTSLTTLRLRFVLGEDELPPIRYIRAYGPNPSAEGVFEIDFPEKDRPAPPLQVSVSNGHLVKKDDDGKRTTTQSVQLDSRPFTVRVNYVLSDDESSTRTRVAVRGETDTQDLVTFFPAEVAGTGRITLGNHITIRYQKSDTPTTSPTR